MDKQSISALIKEVIVNTVGQSLAPNPFPDDYPLLGNLLDSLAVTNLIVALEEQFGIFFNDDDLSAEAFATVNALVALLDKKLNAG